jgi:hypothetical protein
MPTRKSRRVLCLGILGAKSVAPSLGVPCDLSNVEAMCYLENVEPAGTNVIGNYMPRPFKW